MGYNLQSAGFVGLLGRATAPPTASGIPAGFAGPTPGTSISSTDSRWVLDSAGGDVQSPYYHPSYRSQPVLYFDRSTGYASRAITVYVGAAGLRVFNGDSADLALDYTLTSADGALAASFTMRVAAMSGSGANQLVNTLAPGAVPPGVYTLRGTHTLAMKSAGAFGVFDTIDLL